MCVVKIKSIREPSFLNIFSLNVFLFIYSLAHTVHILQLYKCRSNQVKLDIIL